MLALLLDGRLLLEALPLGRTLALLLVEGRLLIVGRLLVVGLLALPLALGRTELLLPLMVGRDADVLLLFTLALEAALPDILPLALALRPSCWAKPWLIEPAVLLSWRTLAT